MSVRLQLVELYSVVYCRAHGGRDRANETKDGGDQLGARLASHSIRAGRTMFTRRDFHKFVNVL